MSTYLMSDIHGDLLRFQKALKKIQFNKKQDVLYIIGDIVDRGEFGIEMLRYAKNNSDWLHLLLGNHEYFLRRYLTGGNAEEKKLEESTYRTYRYGGIPTMKSASKLDRKERNEFIKFLYSLPLYEIIDTPKGKVVLNHTGLNTDYLVYNEDGKISVTESIEAGYEAARFDSLVSIDLHMMPAAQLAKLDYSMIVGHYQCKNLNEDGSNKIYHGKNYMCIDGGCGYPEEKGELAVYRVEDGMEFYF